MCTIPVPLGPVRLIGDELETLLEARAAGAIFDAITALGANFIALAGVSGSAMKCCGRDDGSLGQKARWSCAAHLYSPLDTQCAAA